MRRSAADVELHATGVPQRVYFLPSKLQMLQSLLSSARQAARPKCEATKLRHRCNEKICRLNHCVRGVNDLSRRGAMDQGRLRRFRSQLASRAGGSRETSRQSSGPAWSSEMPSTIPNVKWTTLCTYTNSWGRLMMRRRPRRRRRIGGGGLHWVAWPGVGATDGACRGGAARDPGRRGRPRRPTRYSLRQMRRNAAKDFAGRS